MEVLSGIVERVTFFSEESGWSVLKVSPFNQAKDLVTVTVHQAKIFAGATVQFQGEWTEHSQYGPQFKASQFFEKKPASSAALEKYLGSGLIYGVGPKTAKKIVSYFKQDTLDIFEHDMEKLKEVRGIAQRKLEKIKKSWIEHREIRNVMTFLQTHGISTLFSVKIYKKYGNNAISIVQENPYRLSKDIFGIGFFSADRIAARLGISGQDPRRIKAAIRHILASSREEGHCYLTLEQVCRSIEKLLQEPLDKLIPKYLREMEENQEIKTRIVEDKETETYGYYSKTLFYDEKYVAEKINLLLKHRLNTERKRAQHWIERFNSKQKIPLTEEQSASVLGVIGQMFSILTGGPGCGKTTTTRAVVKLALAMGKRILLAAPTGRAAQRMEEVIGLPAQTIHRLLVWNPSQGGFKKNEENPLDTDFIILDECSMLDISLTASLLKALNHHKTQVLFIGDQDQLPSIGAGNVLKDLIEVQKVPVFRLTQVFRQGGESLIIKYAHQINNGEVPQIDSPFREPALWSRGCDTLFIDSEEVTQKELRFLHKVKFILKGQINKKGDGLVKIEGPKEDQFKKVSRDNKEFFLEEMSEHELNELKKGNIKDKIFSIPKKFRHIQIENLLATSSEAEEIREILSNVHPLSSLHYGITASDMILKLYKDIIPKYLGKGLEIQILTSMTRGSMGTFALNKKIQNEFNVNSPNKKQLLIGTKIFRQGDRVIQKKNNYDLEVFNGDIGKVVDMNLSSLELMVSYPAKKGRIITYKKENLMELDLAYAITIHKSQGSEFNAVIIPIATQHFKLLFRNLIYTGITRAKKFVIFVGTRRALAMAVKNIDNRQRQTFLKELIHGDL